MSGKSRNEGVRIIGDFTDRAIPLGPAGIVPDPSAKPSRSINAGVYPLADFKDSARPLAALPVAAIEQAIEQLAALIVKQVDPAKVSALVQERLIAQVKTLQNASNTDHRGDIGA